MTRTTPLLIAGFASMAAITWAGESTNDAAAAFEALKSLEGRWVGTEKNLENAQMDVEYVYAVMSNGSAVMETAMPGTDKEMITVFYLAGDELLATHFCMVGNQPAFRYSPNDESGVITMAFAGGTGFDPGKDGHVHDGRIRIVDSDNMTQHWTWHQDGAQAGAMDMTLSRVE